METSLDRLVPPDEAKRIVGVRSLTTFYKLIADGEPPNLIKRGRRSYHLESDLRAYLRRLSETRQ